MSDSQSTAAMAASSARGRQAVLWIIASLLGAIALLLALQVIPPWVRPAVAQQQAMAGARGVYAFTGPIDRDQYGLFMLDVDQGTIWCYAFDRAGETRKLRLVAARTWVYDRYLQDFNCAPPDFRMVQQLVAEQRARTRNELRPGADDDDPLVPPQQNRDE